MDYKSSDIIVVERIKPLFPLTVTQTSISANEIALANFPSVQRGVLSSYNTTDTIDLHKVFSPGFKDASKSVIGAVLSFTTPLGLLSNMDSSILLSALVVLITTYMLTVLRLRFRAINDLQKRYGTTPEEFKDIDYKDAQNILVNLFLLDAPWLFLTAKDFAFLRVSYLIPT